MTGSRRVAFGSVLLFAVTLILEACGGDQRPMPLSRSDLSTRFTVGHLYVLNDGGPAGNK